MELFQYLILSTTCMSLSYITFRLFLKNETGFQIQRVFIVATLVISLLLPLNGNIITFPGITSGTNSLPDGVISLSGFPAQPAINTPEPGFIARNSIYIISTYILIVLIFITALAVQLTKIIRLSAVSGRTRQGRIVILTHPSVRTPFSFFNLVFIPDYSYSREERENILIHESIHAYQYHSLDNLLIGLTAALMWFNPLVWMMKNSLHLIHEYLADEGTLGTGVDKHRYQAILVNQVSEERLICLSSSFKNTSIKKRMIMMTKNENRKNSYKIFSILPLFAVMFLTVSVIKGFFPQEIKAEILKEFPVLESGSIGDTKHELPQDTIKVKKPVTVRISEGQKGDTIILKNLGKGENVIWVTPSNDDKSKYQIDTIKDNKVKVVVINKGADGEIKKITRTGPSGKTSPDSLKKAGVRIMVRKDVENEGEEFELIELEDIEEIEINEGEDHVKEIVVVKPESGVNKKEIIIKEIDPEDIEEIVVVKPKSGAKEKEIIIREKDGKVLKEIKEGNPEKVIFITSKKSGDNKPGRVEDKLKLAGVSEDVVYIIDDKTVDKEAVESLDPGQIESINVLKGDTPEIKKYTDKKGAGVIIIKTKKESGK